MKAELLFTGFICDYDLLISTADHAGKLLKVMFPDSKIAKKYSCGRKRQQMFYLELSLKSQFAIRSQRCPLQTSTSGLVLLLMVAVMKMTSFYPCLSDTLHQMVLLQHLYWTCQILTRGLIRM